MKGNRKTFVITLIVSIIVLLFFVFDYFNIPTKLGFYVNAINYDLWGILIGNGVVIALFVITYNLFDKRNLEKERLADYAAAVMILEDYRKCEGILPLVESILETAFESRNEFSPDFIERINNSTFKNSKKIFDFVSIGHITKMRYEKYLSIKGYYDTLIFCVLSIKENQEDEKKYYEKFKAMLVKELEDVDNYIKLL